MSFFFKNVVLFLFIHYTSGLHANTIIDIEHPENSLRRFSTYAYNQLKTVEEADRELQNSGQFPEFLEKATALAATHKVSKIFGLRLAHRHTELRATEKMVENYELWNTHKALVTRPLEGKGEKNIYPASWILGSDGYEVFEYSQDSSVGKNFNTLLSKPQLFIDFYNLSKSYNFHHVVCPAILTRDWDNAFLSSTSFSLVERSYEIPAFMSVVMTEEKVDLQNPHFIVTAWKLPQDPITNNCYQCCYQDYDRHKGYFHNLKHIRDPRG